MGVNMRWLLKMAEVARIQGIDGYDEDHINIKTHQYLRFKDITKEIQPIFNDIIAKAESFVFVGRPETDLDKTADRVEAAPFECFCIERSNGDSTRINGLYRRGPQVALAMLVMETSPDDFVFFELVGFEENEGFVNLKDLCRTLSVRYFTSSKHPLYNQEYQMQKHLINEYITFLHHNTEGIEKVKETFKIGPKKDRKKRTLRRIIHISPKKEQAEKSNRNTIIDWSHSFLVRGHWRKLNGIGKNRNGDYCIHGRTFVIPHEKGKGKLIHKTRIVDTPYNPD